MSIAWGDRLSSAYGVLTVHRTTVYSSRQPLLVERRHDLYVISYVDLGADRDSVRHRWVFLTYRRLWATAFGLFGITGLVRLRNAAVGGGRIGNCCGCGYDIRAGVGRCPECGTPIDVDWARAVPGYPA